MVLGEMFMKEDPLHFLITPIHFGITNHIFVINVVKSLVILYLQTFNVIGVVYICKDTSYLRWYLSGILIQQVGISSYVLVIYYTKNFLSIFEVIGKIFLPLDACGVEIHQKLLRQCTLTRKLYPLVFVIIIGGHCASLPLVRSLTDYQFTVMFINKHFGDWSNFFLLLYYLCMISLGYSNSCLCSVTAYLVIHTYFQLHLLINYLKEISLDIDHMEDTLYQNVIHKRLTSFIQVHNKIKVMTVRYFEIGKWGVLVTSLTGSLLFTSMGYILALRISPLNDVLCVLGLVLAGVVSYLAAIGGQTLQDESFNLYSAVCQCDWMEWNVQNRRTLLMIIINTSKTLKLTSFGILDLGNEILLKMVKFTYSLVLLCVNTNE